MEIWYDKRQRFSEREVLLVAGRNQNGPKDKRLFAMLVLAGLILFLWVGNRMAEERLAEPVEVAKEVSRTSSIYQEILEDHQLASESSRVRQADEGNKNDQASSSIEDSSGDGTSSSSESESSGDSTSESQQGASSLEEAEDLGQLYHQNPPSVPGGQAYVEVNDNVPIFTDADLTDVEESWERYSPLDDLGRVSEANALLGADLMPAESEQREALTAITPTGWQQNRYDIVSAGWLYNRSHLIGFQLTGQQDNLLNLMTGTRYFNVEGMLPFENYVAAYVEDSENHVRYRITPLFMGDELLARGIFMEAYSIEDDGELQFHVYIPNNQPGIEIDYRDGSNQLAV